MYVCYIYDNIVISIDIFMQIMFIEIVHNSCICINNYWGAGSPIADSALNFFSNFSGLLCLTFITKDKLSLKVEIFTIYHICIVNILLKYFLGVIFQYRAMKLGSGPKVG